MIAGVGAPGAQGGRLEEVLTRLESMSNPAALKGMARYGIHMENTYGISMPALRSLAKEIGKDHALAEGLWQSGIHEARILASLVDDPKQVSEEQMESWVKDFDSWDVCDQVCSNLFDRTPYAYQKAIQWSGRSEEFVKRAGFVLMAGLATHDKKAGDERFEAFLPFIVRESTDERNFVRKAVSWALRSIGKRNRNLNEQAVAAARQIAEIASKPARWVAADALLELKSEKVQNKVRSK